MSGDNKTVSIRQRMISRILAEENLLQNLSRHYGVDVQKVKTWLTDVYSEEMLRSIITGLDRLKKMEEEARKNQEAPVPGPKKEWEMEPIVKKRGEPHAGKGHYE